MVEYTYGQQYGSDTDRLRDHWNTWITESDFEEMSSIGLNFARLPIGYWSVIGGEGAPYVNGAYDYVGKAVGWAQNHGIKLMLDLHGGKLLEAPKGVLYDANEKASTEKPERIR